MRYILMAVALAELAPRLAAQGPPTLGPGTRVRVQAIGESGFLDQRVEGTIERVSGDTLVVRQKIGGSRLIFVGDPETQLFVFTGRRSSAGRGAVIGGVVGLLGGGILGVIAGEECYGDRPLCFNRKQVALVGGALVGVAGFAIGLIIGAVSPHDGWRLTAPPSGLAGPAGGMPVGFAIAF